jgi:hypothetical protein
MDSDKIQKEILLERMALRGRVLVEQKEKKLEAKITRYANLYDKTGDKRYLTRLSNFIDVDLCPADYGVPEKYERAK